MVELLNLALEHAPEARSDLLVNNHVRFDSADREMARAKEMVDALKAVKIGSTRGGSSWRDPVQPEERLHAGQKSKDR